MRSPPRLQWKRYTVGVIAVLAMNPAAEGQNARVSFEGGALHANGVMLQEAPPSASHRAVAGPREDVAGVAATGLPIAVRGKLSVPLQERGSLMFWYRTDQAYRSGVGGSKFTEKLVELPDALTVSFVAEKSSLTLMVEWQGKREEVFERHIRIILPEFPGPAWHHVAVNWD